MKVTSYLIILNHGIVRVTKRTPSLYQNEIAIKLDIELSNKFFERFVPHASLKVGDDFVLNPDIEVKLVNPSKGDYAEVALEAVK